MQLKDITEVTCATCDSRIVSESVRSIHCNGHGFEEREFECGRRIKFVPNFMRVEVQRDCPHSKKEDAKRSKRQKAFDKIITLVESLDVDAEWKKEIQSYISHLKPSPAPYRFKR